MKTSATQGPTSLPGLTLLEVLVIIAVLLVLFASLLPSRRGPRKALPFMCQNHLKSVSVAHFMYADDHNGLWLLPTRSKASDDRDISASDYFKRLGPYFDRYPGASALLHCPADKAHEPTIGWTNLTDRNISYFINLEAIPRSAVAILSGDRNLEIDGRPVEPGVSAWIDEDAISWGSGLHSSDDRIRRGNLLFADGRVEFVRNELAEVFRRQGATTNRLLLP